MIKYYGIECELYEHYFTNYDGPYLKIKSSKDLEKAYSRGFECMGYPDEVMKEITREEFEIIKKTDDKYENEGSDTYKRKY